MPNFSSFLKTSGLVRGLGGAALLLAAAGPAQAQLFGAAATYSSGGSTPNFAATGDLNGDGRPDIVAANNSSSSSTLGVLLKQANGSYGPAVTYATGGSTPNEVALGDVNADGKLDAVVVNFASSNIGVLLGTGTGTLGTATLYALPAGANPFGVRLADIDKDGRLDIVASNSYFNSGNGTTGGSISILLNSAGGTFGTPTTYVIGGSPRCMVLADFNKDGALDIAATSANTASNSAGSGLLYVLPSQGSGFGPVATYSIGSNSYLIATGDLNKDGQPDLVYNRATGGGIGVLTGKPGGTFNAQTTYTVGGSFPTGVDLGDVNGDGQLDVIVGDYYASAIQVMPGTSTGTFGTATAYPTGGNPYDVNLVDMNGDGSLDVLAANTGSGSVAVLLSPTAAPVLTSISPATGQVGTSVTLTGTNLAGATAVSFNGTAATVFSAINATTVTATVPAGTTTGNVTVTTPGGTSNGVLFTLAAPTNNALAFDGNSDFVSVPHSAGFNITSAITLEAWVRTTDSGERYITTKAEDSWYLALNGAGVAAGRASFYLNGPSGSSGGWLYGTTNLADGKWHHVAGTYDGSTLRLYVDGSLQASRAATGAIFSGTNPVQLGSRNGGGYWLGSLEEFRIYSTALNVLQVQADMFGVNSSAAPASLVAYYNFDQGVAGGTNTGLTTLVDQSGNAHPGTLNTFALTGTASNWVRSFPTISALSPTSGAAGTSVTITGTNLTDATSFAFNGAAVSPFTTPASDLTATITVPASASTGPVSVASALLTKYNGPVFNFLAGDLLVNTTMSIIPATYNNVTVTSTGNGTLSDDIVINGALVVQDGGALSDGCHLFTGPGTFTLAAGGTLSICRPRGILAVGDAQGNIGAVRTTGGRSFSADATYVYTGSDVTGSGLPSQVRSLVVASNSSLALTQPVAVAQTLALSNSGDLMTNGQALTLLSSSIGTALVVNAGTGVVSGAGTMQRYIDPSLNSGAGYRHYASPVASTTVADLATSGYSPVVNPAYNTSATPGTVTPFPTVYGYDQSRLASTSNNLSAFDKGFFSPASLGTALAPGQGYAVQIGASQLVDFVGTFNNGDLTVPLVRNSGATAADAGWALVGNPYPAPLNFGQVAAADRAGLDAACYVVQSSGPYAGNYRSYVNGLPVGGGFIGSSQGFFVRVASGNTSGALTFHNSQRVVSYANQVPVYRTTADTRPLIQLELRTATGQADALYVYAETGATDAFDSQYDAVKLPNSTGLNLSSTASSSERLAIDGRAAFTAASALPLNVGAPAAGTYTLSAVALNNLASIGLEAYLHDAATSQRIKLSVGTSYSFSLTTAQVQALITGRFTLQFSPQQALATAPSLSAAEVAVYPNPAHGSFGVQVPAVAGAGSVQAELLNTLGQVVRQQRVALPAAGVIFTVPANDLAPGVYTLRLQAGVNVLAKRIVLN